MANQNKKEIMAFKMANDKVAYMAKVAGNPSMEITPADRVMAAGDPGGYFMDFKVPTPGYMKSAGYGYNPDHTYSFRFKGKDNKTLRTSEPISDEEYESGGYKLVTANYKPIQNQNVDIGSDTEGYNRLKPETSSMPSGENNAAAQTQANKKNNPYITQVTQFNRGGGQQYTTNYVTRGFKNAVSNYDLSSPNNFGNAYRTYDGTGAESTFTTRPNESGSNDMSSISGFRFNNASGGNYDPATFPAMRTFRTASNKGVNAPTTGQNPTFTIPVISHKFSTANKRDQRAFSRAIGPGMMSILKNLNYTSPSSGETRPKFRVKN